MSASLSILVVEDEPLIAMMLEDFLESLGHRVHARARAYGRSPPACERSMFPS
jgi:CheY-like chemotaxis protein